MSANRAYTIDTFIYSVVKGSREGARISFFTVSANGADTASVSDKSWFHISCKTELLMVIREKSQQCPRYMRVAKVLCDVGEKRMSILCSIHDRLRLKAKREEELREYYFKKHLRLMHRLLTIRWRKEQEKEDGHKSKDDVLHNRT
jgi:hypothetical protein